MCCVCCRLRDLSAQDKLENQRVMKDLEKAHSDLKTATETKDKLQAELKVCVWGGGGGAMGPNTYSWPPECTVC